MARRKQRRVKDWTLTILSIIGDIFKSPVLISWVLAIGGLITLTAMSVPRLRATRISAANIQVSFTTPPVWLDDSLLVELQNVARAHLAQRTVGRDGLINTANAMLNTGWFTEVQQVQWITDRHASVEATFLVPYAKVKDSIGEIYIDSQGRRLPTRNGIIVNPKYHFITFENSIHNRPQYAGSYWNGDDVLAGLKVLHTIYQKEWATQIQSIDLSGWKESGSLVFNTDTPSRFIWGSAPNEERKLEALCDEKITRLTWLHANFGRIDKGISAEFNLTNTSEVTRN